MSEKYIAEILVKGKMDQAKDYLQQWSAIYIYPKIMVNPLTT